MVVKGLFQNLVTGVLVVCAVVVTFSVWRTYRLASATSYLPPTRRISGWDSLGNDREPSLGAPSSAVRIVEFSDYECRFCRQLEGNLQELVRIYPGAVQVKRYEFPLTDIHPHAYQAAIAAECAAEQGVYEPYQVLLFENGADLGKADWIALAQQAGVPKLPAFSLCVLQQQTREIVSADQEVGNRLGVRATPTLIIDGSVVEGVSSPEGIKQLVQQALKDRQRWGLWQRLEQWF
jgi:protein-disulfide isomerase